MLLVQRVDADLALAEVVTPRGIVVVTVAAETSAAAQLTCRGPEGVKAREYRGVAISDVGDGAAGFD